MLKKYAVAAGVALSLAWASPASADAITFDPTGTAGAAGDIQIDLMDPLPGNSIALNGNASLQPGQVVTALYQANLGSTSLDGTINYSPLQAGDYFTIVAGFTETVVSSTVVAGLGTIAFDVNDGGYFYIYHNEVGPGSDLSGVCFTCGTLVLSGTFVDTNGDVGAAGVDSTFNVTSVAPGLPLDGFGADNYPAIDTIDGGGAFDVTIQVTFANALFFPGLSIGDTFIFASSQQTLNYEQANPSACFSPTGAGGVLGCTQPGATVGSVGTINGLNGPNTMFQTDANMSFQTQQVVPEPATLTLLGAGLLGGLNRMRARSRRARS